jgi:hypothetical protein
MGSKNNFRELKCYGRKIVSFNQKKVLNSIQEIVEASDWDKVKKGVCAALTMAWLEEQIRPNPRGTLFVKKADFHTSAFDYQGAVFNAIPKQLEYMQEAYESGNAEAGIIALAKAHHVHLLDMPLNTDFSQLRRFPKEIPIGMGYYISLRERFKNGIRVPNGHGIGMCRLADGKTYFYDANVGSYHVLEARMNEFFSEYANVYREKVGITYGAIRVWRAHTRAGFV